MKYGLDSEEDAINKYKDKTNQDSPTLRAPLMD